MVRKRDRRLFAAARDGNMAQLERALARGANLGLCHEDGLAALHVAALHARHDALERLLASPLADVDVRTAAAGEEEEEEEEEEGGRRGEETALHVAARAGRHSAVRILLAAGADATLVDGGGRRAAAVAKTTRTAAMLAAAASEQSKAKKEEVVEVKVEVEVEEAPVDDVSERICASVGVQVSQTVAEAACQAAVEEKEEEEEEEEKKEEEAKETMAMETQTDRLSTAEMATATDAVAVTTADAATETIAAVVEPRPAVETADAATETEPTAVDLMASTAPVERMQSPVTRSPLQPIKRPPGSPASPARPRSPLPAMVVGRVLACHALLLAGPPGSIKGKARSRVGATASTALSDVAMAHRLMSAHGIHVSRVVCPTTDASWARTFFQTAIDAGCMLTVVYFSGTASSSGQWHVGGGRLVSLDVLLKAYRAANPPADATLLIIADAPHSGHWGEALRGRPFRVATIGCGDRGTASDSGGGLTRRLLYINGLEAVPGGCKLSVAASWSDDIACIGSLRLS